jgi:hypothetical protein
MQPYREWNNRLVSAVARPAFTADWHPGHAPPGLEPVRHAALTKARCRRDAAQPEAEGVPTLGEMMPKAPAAQINEMRTMRLVRGSGG